MGSVLTVIRLRDMKMENRATFQIMWRQSRSSGVAQRTDLEEFYSSNTFWMFPFSNDVSQFVQCLYSSALACIKWKKKVFKKEETPLTLDRGWVIIFIHSFSTAFPSQGCKEDRSQSQQPWGQGRSVTGPMVNKESTIILLSWDNVCGLEWRWSKPKQRKLNLEQSQT